MVAGKRMFLITLGCLILVLPVVGCGGDDACDCCDLPHGTKDWLIDVDLGHVPDVVAEYPFLVNITVWVSDFENGSPAPNGQMVNLAVSPGSFDDGPTEIDRRVANGRVSAVVVADEPAVYTLRVQIPGDTSSATVSFSIGM